LSLARQHAHRSGAAQILRELGGLAWAQGQFEQAQRFLNEALDSLYRLGDEREVALTRQELGILARVYSL
jgi:uncharacterized protein HemY